MRKTSATMAFSITAPFISDEAYRKAKESLSESELQHIHNDLFGIPNKCIATATNDDSICTSPRTSSLDFFNQDGDGKIEDGNNIHQRLSNSLDVSVKQTIGSDGCDCSNESLRRQLGHKLIRESLDQLPIELNDAYRVAIEKNPTLFNSSECNWDYYIYQYNNDAWAAAEGIARYWTLRRTTFGAERYYKSMTFEREGCMYDIKNEFSYGGIRIDGYDNHGRPILFAERETVTSMHRDISVQLFFFWIHQLIYNRHQIPYVDTQRNNLASVTETRSSNPVADGVNPYDDNNDDAAVTAGPRIISSPPSHQDFSYIMVVNLKVCFIFIFLNCEYLFTKKDFPFSLFDNRMFAILFFLCHN